MNKGPQFCDVKKPARVVCKTCREAKAKDPNIDVLSSLYGLFIVFRLKPSKKDAKDGGAPADSSASPSASDKQKEVDPLSQFVVGFVDPNGWLEPQFEGMNPWHVAGCKNSKCKLNHAHITKTWRVTAEQTYEGYLVRHPNPELSWALRSFLIDPATLDPRFDFSDLPEAKELVFKMSKLPGTQNESPVLELEEDPSLFYPRGHKAYGEWALYSEMPNGRCKAVREHVEFLQHHMGALRYPVGNAADPYAPFKGDKKNPGNLGCFDMQLMAVVGRFQNHVMDGRAFLLASQKETIGQLLQPGPPYKPVATAPREDLAPGKARLSWKFLVGEPIRPRWKNALAWVKGLDAPPPREDDAVAVEVDSPGDDPKDKLKLSEERIQGSVEQSFCVVDRVTGELIAHWIRHGLRKPGKILVKVTALDEGASDEKKGYEWVREDCAIRLEMWRRLAKSMGCDYGISLGSAFRHIETGRKATPKGMIPLSTHKAGLAIDLAMIGLAGVRDHDVSGVSEKEIQDYSSPINAWPIRFECDRQLGGIDTAALLKRAKDKQKALSDSITALKKKPSLTAEEEKLLANKQADKELLEKVHIPRLEYLRDTAPKSRLLYRVKWRIYGHSELDEKNTVDIIKSLRIAPDDFIQRIAQYFGIFDFSSGSEFPQRLDEWNKTFTNICKGIANTGNEIAGAFFRGAIIPFQYNPYEPDGGTNCAPLKPNDEKTLIFERLDAANSSKTNLDVSKMNSWLNLTALGHECGLYRIGAQAVGWRDPTFENQFIDPPRVAISVVSKDLGKSNFGLIVGLLQRLWAPDSAHVKDPIEITDFRSINTESVYSGGFSIFNENLTCEGHWHSIKRKSDELDLELMKKWLRAFGHSAFIIHFAHKNSDKCYKLARDAIQKLKSDFGETRFILFNAGPSTGLGLDDEIRKGSEWAKVMEEKLEKFSQSPGYKNEKMRDVTSEAFRVTLQPVFDKTPKRDEITFQPNQIVILSTPGVGRTLEWWHYQTEAVCTGGKAVNPEDEEDPEEKFDLQKKSRPPDPRSGPTWGRLMGEIGYSQLVLGSPTIPPLMIADVKNRTFTSGYAYDVGGHSNTAAGPAENGPAPAPGE